MSDLARLRVAAPAGVPGLSPLHPPRVGPLQRRLLHQLPAPRGLPRPGPATGGAARAGRVAAAGPAARPAAAPGAAGQAVPTPTTGALNGLDLSRLCGPDAVASGPAGLCPTVRLVASHADSARACRELRP